MSTALLLSPAHVTLPPPTGGGLRPAVGSNPPAGGGLRRTHSCTATTQHAAFFARERFGVSPSGRTPCPVDAKASSSPRGTEEASRSPTGVEKAINQATTLFPLWVALGCLSGLAFPDIYLSWFKPAYVTAMLAVTMMGMGFTLSVQDIKDVLDNPGRVTLGALLQYTIMPTLGFLLARLPGISPACAAGIVLVSCCPGGTASNIITYLARADVALSVMMTTVSTLAAVVLTPLLTTKLIGTSVPVDGFALFVSTLQVVLAPVAAGVALKSLMPRFVARIVIYAPLTAVLMVALICAAVMAKSATAIKAAGPLLLAAVFSLHLGGFSLGYVFSRLLSMPERTCRTNSIEVGMQNSTLGASLALMHFSDPITAAPCAISACMHSMLGSAIAGAWRWRDASLRRRQGDQAFA